MADDLEVTPDLVIPAAELAWTFTTAGGPGGQHANRAASRAELRFDLGSSPSVPDELRSRMLERLGSRARRGVVTAVSGESRSQWRNRQIARRRLRELLEGAVRQVPERRPTRPSAGQRERRLQDKRHRSRAKRLRRPPEDW